MNVRMRSLSRDTRAFGSLEFWESQLPALRMARAERAVGASAAVGLSDRFLVSLLLFNFTLSSSFKNAIHFVL